MGVSNVYRVCDSDNQSSSGFGFQFLRQRELRIIREFMDVVFDDVVLDDNSCVTLLYIYIILFRMVTSMQHLLLSSTTSSNTMSLNS